MAWEKRKDHEYFYRSRRTRDGRVVKDYFGNGAAAEIEAARMARKATQRREAEQAEIWMCQAVGPADQALAELDNQCRLLIEATMLAAGYHKRRSEWRKRGCQGRPRKKPTQEPTSSRNSAPSRSEKST